MARIRYIKPEFFFDEDLAELSYQDRLAFIGLWCHADRAGRLEDSHKMLKAKIFPYDKADMNAILDRLCAKPFIVRYEIDGNRYIQIVNFLEHQRPHHTEQESVIPEFNGVLTVKQPLYPDGEGKGNGKGNGDGEGPRALFNLFNETTNNLPKAREFTSDRESKCRLRLRERPLADWKSLFERMDKTPFLSGDNNTGWRATFDWIIANQTNAAKVLEGKYDSGKPQDRNKQLIDRI